MAKDKKKIQLVNCNECKNAFQFAGDNHCKLMFRDDVLGSPSSVVTNKIKDCNWYI